jgi:hypothetical protein
MGRRQTVSRIPLFYVSLLPAAIPTPVTAPSRCAAATHGCYGGASVGSPLFVSWDWVRACWEVKLP